jgi:hypothetical protein
MHISYDEKTGLQATKNTSPNIPPVQGKDYSFSSDHEYNTRLGPVSILAVLHIVTGKVDCNVDKGTVVVNSSNF